MMEMHQCTHCNHYCPCQPANPMRKLRARVVSVNDDKTFVGIYHDAFWDEAHGLFPVPATEASLIAKALHLSVNDYGVNI